MSILRASNPDTGASLLDRSTAKPGSLDLSIFEKNSKAGSSRGRPIGQGTVNSNYLQQCREDNPAPPPAAKKASIRLSKCKISTSKEKLNIDKPFDITCQVEFINDYTPTNAKVSISFVTRIEGKDYECREKFYGIIDLGIKDQSVLVSDKLPKPPIKPHNGETVTYIAIMRHPEAENEVQSDPIDIIVTDPDEISDQNEHIEDRTVEIKTADGGTLIGASYIICENGKVLKKGVLDEKSQARYSAKQGCKYSVYLVNAGKIEKDDAR
jgi:hypothetical protein